MAVSGGPPDPAQPLPSWGEARAHSTLVDTQDEDVALTLVHRQRPVRLFLADLVSLVGGVLKQFYWNMIHIPYNIPSPQPVLEDFLYPRSSAFTPILASPPALGTATLLPVSVDAPSWTSMGRK